MRWGLFTTRMIIILVTVVISVIILLSIVPLAQGGLNIRMPQGDSQWEYNDNVLEMQMPVSVYNGGYYDIQDFTLGFSLRDNSTRVLASSQTAPMDIVHGKWTTLPLAMDIDLKQMDPATMSQLVFHDASLNMSIDLSAEYTDQMVKIDLGGYSDINWSALISDMIVDTADMTIHPNGNFYTVTIPYHFDASNIIDGSHLTVGATLRNATAALGTVSNELSIQQSNVGEFAFNITPAAAQDLMTRGQTLYVDSSATFEGATFNQTYSLQSQPSMSNVSMGSINPSSSGPSYELSIPNYLEASSTVQGNPATINVAMTMLGTNSGDGSMTMPASTDQWLAGHIDGWSFSDQLNSFGATLEKQQSRLWDEGGAP